MNKYYYIAALMSIAPHVASAQPTTFRGISSIFIDVLKGLIALLFASLVVGLLYGVVRYLASGDNERVRDQYREYLLWSVVGVTVVFALWGILAILSNTLGWNGVGIPFITPPA